MFYIEAILPLALHRTFTYSVTQAEYDFIKPGMRVAVPFGRNKLYTAVVSSLHQNPPENYQARDIDHILDEKPAVTAIQLEHWQWIASYYMCAIGDVYRGALPSALLLESETIISLSPGVVNTSQLGDDEFLVYQALTQQSALKLEEIAAILGRKSVFPVIRNLLEKQVATLREEITDAYKPKVEKYYRLSEQCSNDLQSLMELLKNAGKQREAVMAYFQLSAGKKPVRAKELMETASVNSAVLRSLAVKGILETYEISQDRVVFDDAESGLPILTDAQKAAMESINTGLEQKDVALLHGVTSSGKTEIYINLIAKSIATGKQVLYLLPEIALTAQLVGRLTRHFGNQVTVYHSKYSNSERIEAWNRTLENADSARVIIGARSALFLPFQQLGLVIVDEEHEQMFRQQDPAPRYHARDAAIVLAKMHGAKVVLGSATPAIETYHNSQTGKYALTTLSRRYADAPMPDIELVDLKDKYFRKKMTGHFSDTLIEHITSELSAKKQVILFQNRRGYSPVVECLTCGNVPQCRQCDVSLTYHKSRNQLRCHYCGFAMAMPTHCHACSSVELTTKGFGTEQIQLELSTIFPEAKSIRMDQDTTRGKYGFERIIDTFRNREADILVGTQMLAKGLDFDSVSLVGIMNADNMLYHPDFRAFERSFQMMEQVAGRAGRAGEGKVLIQTYNPAHPIIRQVVAHDYLGMYRDQLSERQAYRYPPFYKLIKLTLRCRDFEKLVSGATWLTGVLRSGLDMPVLGPEEPPVGRIRNEYLRTVLVKIPPGMSLEAIKKTIRRMLDSFEAVSQYRAIKVTINVDVY